jgi:hypothetical protein
MSDALKDGGTVGETPELTLKQEAERARVVEMYCSAKLALDSAGAQLAAAQRNLVACRVACESMRAWLNLSGFPPPSEDEIKRALRRIAGPDVYGESPPPPPQETPRGGTGPARPPLRLVTDGE